MKKWSVKKTIGLIAVLIVLVAAIGFEVYVSDYYHATEEAEQALLDAGAVKEENWYVFASEGSTKGLIFYPGAKVEYTAYAPLMQEFSEEGIHVYLVQMPFNLAFFGVNRAEDVMEAHPEITTWYMCGHSLGGAFASNFAANHTGDVDGVCVLGAYIYGEYPLDNTLTIYGSNDLVLNREKIDYTENVYVVEGGNHAGFGNYGAQDGDGEATITSAEQQEETAELFSAKFLTN